MNYSQAYCNYAPTKIVWTKKDRICNDPEYYEKLWLRSKEFRNHSTEKNWPDGPEVGEGIGWAHHLLTQPLRAQHTSIIRGVRDVRGNRGRTLPIRIYRVVADPDHFHTWIRIQLFTLIQLRIRIHYMKFKWLSYRYFLPVYHWCWCWLNFHTIWGFF